jgi:imidazolonepropionase-like amidohydrolase
VVFVTWWSRHRNLVASLAVVLAAATSAPGGAQAETKPPEQKSNTFVVSNVRIFDGVRVIGIGSVLVVRGRIAAVGAVGKVRVPSGTPVYDGRGKTLLPGLIESSSHTLDAVVMARDGLAAADRHDALRFGVTTQVDPFGDPELIAEARQERQSLDRTDRADLWSAGVGVTVPGGFPPDRVLEQPFPRLTTDEDPDRFVADRLQEGSDFVTFVLEDGGLYHQTAPTLTPEQARAVVAAAHRRGRSTVAEATELEQARIAVQAGADGLNHVPFDAVVDDAFRRAIRRQDSYVVTTLATFDCGVGADNLLQDTRVRPLLSDTQVAALNLRFPNCPESWRNVGLQNIRRLHSAGVPILAGTDAGGGVAAHGASMLVELADLVAAGLTPAQALTAATAAPAHQLRLADRGRIASGRRADLLLINGNPTEDITAMPDIAQIWKNGYPVDRTPPQ